ncbi:exo-beta-N-acetylmuramidase NamZ family protein [Lacticaseibacillus hegangensis]|uniref:Exo-beta-N-acetylmuramidase NamZ domain-containing protein n=1 Tax=Lacticaseibacillus hegangensis TaxID=2486010 RepID=A0ABW4CVR8_9LACO|nr:DUF1343 domain-containing protein [Lacticaseibacillus hegangensis]
MTLLGIENERVYRSIITDRRVALITNFTGMDQRFRSSVDLIRKDATLVRIFTPEHGLYGIAGAGEAVGSFYDKRLKVDVVSLYGDKRAPKSSELEDIDALVFDIQDIGVRYYTYIYTLLEAMKVAARVGTPLIVMDRPLPLGRQTPVGVKLQPDYFSFVGQLPLPNRYGLTIGELATWMREQFVPEADLNVVPMVEWNPDLTITQNGLPWVPPSPNLPTLSALKLYTGLCLIEGTNVSEGRGTVRPFEQIGAPWINADQFAHYLTQIFPSSGVRFQPVWFKPLSSKHEGEVCQGTSFHIMTSDWSPLMLGYIVLKALVHMYPNEFNDSLVSPQIGTAHHFIEYLAGASLQTEEDLDSLIASPLTDSFSEETRRFWRY